MNFARFIIFCFANICILCSETTNKIYVTLQGINKVGILYDDTMDTSTIDIDYDLDGEAGQDSPHFIVIDKINRYWFVTTFRSEYVGRYNLDTDQLIDIIPVGDAPALMVLNEQDKKLYVSRMMPMGAMMTGAISTVVQEIDYSDPETMELSYEFSVGSPTPHGLAINQDGSEIYVASNTADWLYKIMPATNERDSVVMDPNSLNIFAPNLETDKLKPIQCISVKDSLLFITCSGGITSKWNSTDNVFEYYTIPGQVQLWNTNSMTKIDSIEFNWESHPWHIIDSPIRDEVFVALAGESDSPNTAGVVCLSYASNNISLIWENYSDEFNNATLHGIDISNDGETLFVSGREDGHLHILDANTGTLTQSISFTLDPSEAQPTGIAVLSSIVDMAIANIPYVPQIITLNNYPNPFNPQTTISFSIPTMQNVTVEIIDLQGRVVKSFFNRHLLSGSHSIVWYAESYPSGQYLINMSSDTYVKTAKATLIK